MKTLETILRNEKSHWVGDGFPVRSLFSYHGHTSVSGPLLLFDYAGPWNSPLLSLKYALACAGSAEPVSQEQRFRSISNYVLHWGETAY